MPQLRVFLGFTNASDHSLEETAGAVIDGMTGNATYTSPPVTMAALKTGLTNFTDAIAAQAQGGTTATANKNNKREALIGLLRQLAGFVQSKCANDMAKLLSSGFEAVSTNHAKSPLVKPHIHAIENGHSGQLIVRVTPVKNAKCYEVRYAVIAASGAPGTWQTGSLFTNSRAMTLSGLTPGTNYSVEVRAIGGSTGYSDWSDPVSHMSL